MCRSENVQAVDVRRSLGVRESAVASLRYHGVGADAPPTPVVVAAPSAPVDAVAAALASLAELPWMPRAAPA